MDWGERDPVPSGEARCARKGPLSPANNGGDSRRSERVKSAAPRRKSPTMSGGKFFSPQEQQSQCPTACLTEGTAAQKASVGRFMMKIESIKVQFSAHLEFISEMARALKHIEVFTFISLE